MNEFHEAKLLAEELEAKGPHTFFEEHEILDLEYTVDPSLGFRGASALITCGGPNVLINSYTGSVEIFWGYEETIWYLSADCKAAVEDYFREMYQEIAP